MPTKKPRKVWMYDPKLARKHARADLTPALKQEVQQRAEELIETTLKPAHIKPPRKNQRWNYIADLYCKWFHYYFYFCATYNCPGPNALSPSFERKFARMEYVGARRFALAFMRYNGEGIEVYPSLTLNECLKNIKDDGMFQP